MKLFNATVWSVEEVKKMPLIMTIKSNWRQRMVYHYQHPTEDSQVITHGVWFDGTTENLVVEPREAFARELRVCEQGRCFVTTD